MSNVLQKYELGFALLGMEGLVYVTVGAYDEFHALRLAEQTFKATLHARVESIKLVTK